MYTSSNLRQASQLQCNVFTDGSKIGSEVGGGVAVYRDQKVVDEISFKLPESARIFLAEISAICVAATDFYIRIDRKLKGLSLIHI